MKKIFIFILFSTLIMACTTENKQNRQEELSLTRTYQRTIKKIPNSIQKTFQSMEGCTKEFVFNILGLPNDERTIDNQKYFYWEINSNYTSFWTGNNNQQNCIIHGKVNNKGIIEEIAYRDFRKGCNYIYANIVRYYVSHTQDEDNCPNRKDFYGKFTVTEEY